MVEKCSAPVSSKLTKKNSITDSYSISQNFSIKQIKSKKSFELPRVQRPMNPSVSSKSIDFRSNTLRTNVPDQLALLHQMGFHSQLDYKPLNVHESRRDSYSIQLTDFWSGKEKEKFLKQEGLWEAYKEMISNSNKYKLYYSKTLRQPIDSKALDMHTSVKVMRDLEKSKTSSVSKKISPAISPGDYSFLKPENKEKLEKIEKVEENCEKLAHDTRALMKKAAKIQSEISNKFSLRKRNRISEYEIKKIKKGIRSFA